MRRAARSLSSAVLFAAVGAGYAGGCGARSSLDLATYAAGDESSRTDGDAGGTRGGSSASGSQRTRSGGASGSSSSTRSGSRSSDAASPSRSASTSGSSRSSGPGDAGDGGCDGSASSPACACPVIDPVEGTCGLNELLCSYPGASCTCTSACPPGSCCPISCAQAGFPCDPIGDGCGAILDGCRVCPPGQVCGAGHACRPTADAGCVPRACPVSACGVVDDGCGGTINCGGCYWSCGAPDAGA